MPDYPASSAAGDDWRLFLTAVADALTLPPPKAAADELAYLRLLGHRAKAVRGCTRRVLAGDGEPAALAGEAETLRQALAALPAGGYEASPFTM